MNFSTTFKFIEMHLYIQYILSCIMFQALIDWSKWTAQTSIFQTDDCDVHVCGCVGPYVCVIVTEWQFTKTCHPCIHPPLVSVSPHSISTKLCNGHLCYLSLSVSEQAGGNALNAVPGSAWPLGLWYLRVRFSCKTSFKVTCGKLHRCRTLI